MYDFYLKQSSGRYSVTGDVSDWVTVPYNEARYGSNAISEADGYWNFIKDSATAWYNAQVAAGKSTAEIKAYLAPYDIWDRYDYDGDGNFNEADGYIDHFQAVHAGVGEEVGGGAQGDDAIWSHRWYTFVNLAGSVGPDYNPAGGVPIGDSGIWIGDYTTEPENGGIGVFAHEYGHDLGLPDLYDTAGGDNGTGFWTIMSAGSYLNDGTVDLGTKPGYMGAWEKLFLGWLDYGRKLRPGQVVTLAAGARPASGRGGQAARAGDRHRVHQAYSGSYGGGADDNIDNTMQDDRPHRCRPARCLPSLFDIGEDYDGLWSTSQRHGLTTWRTPPVPARRRGRR
jgi:immune inhibitor A